MTQPLTRLVALASLLLPATAHAQEEVLLDTVIVTAAGRPQSLADVQASVQVIDGTALRSGGAANVTEVLRQAVGLDARSSGSNESITIRGQKDSGTLILIDGQPRTGKYGGFGLNNFPVSDIERVEIVRGPMPWAGWSTSSPAGRAMRRAKAFRSCWACAPMMASVRR